MNARVNCVLNGVFICIDETYVYNDICGLCVFWYFKTCAGELKGMRMLSCLGNKGFSDMFLCNRTDKRG